MSASMIRIYIGWYPEHRPRYAVREVIQVILRWPDGRDTEFAWNASHMTISLLESILKDIMPGAEISTEQAEYEMVFASTKPDYDEENIRGKIGDWLHRNPRYGG